MAKYGTITHLENADFDSKGNIKIEEMSSENLPVFFIIYAPWCGHCQTTEPEFTALHKKHNKKGVLISCVNADAEPQLKERLIGILKKSGINFQGFPTLVLYHNQKYREYDGSRDWKDMKKFIKKYIK